MGSSLRAVTLEGEGDGFAPEEELLEGGGSGGADCARESKASRSSVSSS